MKRILSSIALTVLSAATFAESPYDKFSSDKNISRKTSVEWYAVSNVQEVCESENKQMNGHGYGFKVDGCSRWHHSVFSDSCVIYTHLKTDYWTLGHELRHCFQGKFH